MQTHSKQQKTCELIKQKINCNSCAKTTQLCSIITALHKFVQQRNVTQKYTMQKLTAAQAQAAILLHANNNTITATQVQNLLANVSVTFAQITYVTQVQLAAAHKAQNIVKVTTANVMLCSNIKAHTAVYKRKVQRSAAKYASNSASAVAAFTAQQNYFTHTAVHSIVHNNKNINAMYLYCFYNNASSVYMHNNAVVTKQHVAAYCTKSAATALLQQNNTVHNVTHNITHNVQVRTIALHNIVSIKARKQLLTVA